MCAMAPAMRRRWTALLPSLALALPACGGEEGPPDFGPGVQQGSITITWGLEDQDGEPLSCAELGVVDSYVAVGGTPQIIPCGEEQVATFDNLSPQRYPVVVRLRGLAETTIPGGEQLDNIEIVDANPLTYDHTFTFDEDTGNTGRIKARWRIEGGDPMTGCERFGGDTVLIETQEGSIDEFTIEAPCTDGEAEQTNLRPGNYTLRLALLDDANEILAVRQSTWRVLRQSETEVSISFSVQDRPRTALKVDWTVSSSVAADVCQEQWDVRLLLAQDRPGQNPLTITTATTACDGGSFTFEDLIAPVNSQADRFQVTTFLRDPLLGVLDSVLVEDILLFPSRTTTVAVDLDPTGG